MKTTLKRISIDCPFCDKTHEINFYKESTHGYTEVYYECDQTDGDNRRINGYIFDINMVRYATFRGMNVDKWQNNLEKLSKIVINEITFYYDSDKIDINNCMKDIEHVANNADDKAYTVCIMEGEVVIY